MVKADNSIICEKNSKIFAALSGSAGGVLLDKIVEPR
jgi:hypothetical protein